MWCGARTVASFAREELVRRQPSRLTWVNVLINRNHRLLHQAALARRRTEELCAQAADLASPRAVLGFLHSHGVAVGNGLYCRFQGRSARLQFSGECCQVGDGLLVEDASGEASGAGRHLA
jgi:hypothetical protein